MSAKASHLLHLEYSMFGAMLNPVGLGSGAAAELSAMAVDCYPQLLCSPGFRVPFSIHCWLATIGPQRGNSFKNGS